MADDKERTNPFSARLGAATLDRLRKQAARAGSSQSALAERYIEEGLRADQHPLIAFRDAAGGRRPALAGTRHDVWQIVETIRQNDNSLRDAAEYLGLPPTHVEAAARYYADFQQEIDEWIARAREEAEQAESSWRRSRELFA